MAAQIDFTQTAIAFDFQAVNEAELYQNLKVLFTTPVGTVPLDRDLGIDFSILDQPLPMARNKYHIELSQKVQKYEPRVLIKSVVFELDELAGKMFPKVVVSLA